MTQIAEPNKVYRGQVSSFNNVAVEESSIVLLQTAKLFWKDMLVMKDKV